MKLWINTLVRNMEGRKQRGLPIFASSASLRCSGILGRSGTTLRSMRALRLLRLDSSSIVWCRTLGLGSRRRCGWYSFRRICVWKVSSSCRFHSLTTGSSNFTLRARLKSFPSLSTTEATIVGKTIIASLMTITLSA
jgi:hypothetical protein